MLIFGSWGLVKARLAEALCAAARSGHKDFVEILLDRGPPVNKRLEFWAVHRSLGGATADFEVPDAGLAEEPAQTMWRLFLSRTNNSTADGIRLLDGTDISGFPSPLSLQIKTCATPSRSSRSISPEDSGKEYYLPVAPQCPRPDTH